VGAVGVTSFDGGHFHSVLSRTPAAACLGDIFVDHRIDGADLGALLSQWGPASAGTVSDLNRDGNVDGADLGYLLANWGPCSN
jgi:hypothetical protein